MEILQFITRLKHVGFIGYFICKGTLDESPMAYKDTNTIINSISDTCEILYMIKPIINIKATDGAELMEND